MFSLYFTLLFFILLFISPVSMNRPFAQLQEDLTKTSMAGKENLLECVIVLHS